MSELELWNELGNLYYKTGDCNEAIRSYQKVIELDGCSSQPYKNLASIFINQGRYAEALPMLQKGIELTQEPISQASLWNQLGNACRKLEDYTLACAAFRKAVETDPGQMTYQENLAEAELTAAQSSTDADANVIPGQAPENASGKNNALESNEKAESVRACWVFQGEQASNPSKENETVAEGPAPVILGNRVLAGDAPVAADPGEAASLKTGGAVSPAGALERTESVDATVYGLLRLGILHWRKDEFENAARYLEMARNIAESSQDQFHEALAHFVMARVETDLGKIEAAIQSYQSAANLAPERFFPWKALGDLNCKLDRYEDARAAFQEAIEHNPKDPLGWNGLGDVYNKLGRSEEAIAAYQLGNVFDKQDSEQDPLIEFEKAMLSVQDHPEVWNEAGNIYYHSGVYADAIDSYRQAVVLDPDNALYQARLAKAQQALEELNSKCTARAPEPAAKLSSEARLHIEPFVAEKPLPDTEKQSLTQPDPNWNRPAIRPALVPERISGRAGSTGESEHAFWMFKSVTRDVNAQQLSSRYLPDDMDTLVETVEPLQPYAAQQRPEQTYSNKPARSERLHDDASLLVQMPPRPAKPARAATIDNFPVSNRGWESPFVPVEVERRNSPAAANEPKPTPPAVTAISTEDESVDQAAQDLKILEHDIAAFRKVTEINPNNDRAWDTLGNMYGNIGLHSQAVCAFERAIALDPQKEVYYYHLGIALGYLMQYNQAIQALEKVIELDPGYMLAHCALAGYYRRLGRETEAQEHMQIARPSMLHENEYNQACFESIGGNADRAIELLEIALKGCQVQPGLVRNDPDLDFIRKDPRFKELLIKNSMIR